MPKAIIYVLFFEKDIRNMDTHWTRKPAHCTVYYTYIGIIILLCCHFWIDRFSLDKGWLLTEWCVDSWPIKVKYPK